LKEAETLKGPSSEPETEMPEMSEVSPSLQNTGHKQSATTDNLPPGVLYQVKAAYKYQAEDMDELQFEVGEVIDVVEYDDPEEQEEGWLMGVRSSTGQKGLFPANFTRPI
jgi:amphiphysin